MSISDRATSIAAFLLGPTTLYLVLFLLFVLESKAVKSGTFPSIHTASILPIYSGKSIVNCNEPVQLVVRGFDGDRIDKYYNKRPFEVWERLVEVGSPIIGWWMVHKYDSVAAKYRAQDTNHRVLLERAKDFRDAIVQGKSVTFIKSGQALALRPDIVKSREYIAQLQTLQDEVGTFDNDIAMRIIREELGRDAHEIFEFNPPVPIASASIGQVYRARLRSTNQTVAVKVQRPDALETIGVDMFILRRLAAFIKWRKKLRSDMVGIADEFGAQLYEELNYVQEAHNCQRFKELYGNIPGIYVPSPDFEHTTRRVLTMEFVEGTKGPWETGGERMLTVGLQCSVLQLLGTGFFHSDPHRGNLLQTPRGELAYLDFGMMAEVPSNKRFAMIGTVLGLVNKDIPLTINSMNELEFFPPNTDPATVISALTEALNNSTDGASSSSLNFTKLNQNLNSISDRLPFRLPPFYSLIIRSLTILEGLALHVDPSFRLVKGAYPFIARQILSEPSAEMNELLRKVLLTKESRIRWDKLEQFISISSQADKAMAGDFSALQSAQNRSDVARQYQKEESDSEESLESLSVGIATQILDYLLSENGQFLREPLITEIVDTLDSIGLTAQGFVSLLTNRIIPAPLARPDRERMLQLLRVISKLLIRGEDEIAELYPLQQESSKDSIGWESSSSRGSRITDVKGSSSSWMKEGPPKHSRRGNADQHIERAYPRDSIHLEDVDKAEDSIRLRNRAHSEQYSAARARIKARSRKLSEVTRWTYDLLSDAPAEKLKQYGPLLQRLGVLGSQVLERLLERQTRRAVKAVLSPERVEGVLSPISSLVDMLAPSSSRGAMKSRRRPSSVRSTGSRE